VTLTAPRTSRYGVGSTTDPGISATEEDERQTKSPKPTDWSRQQTTSLESKRSQGFRTTKAMSLTY
jgi:hypothetical protein